MHGCAPQKLNKSREISENIQNDRTMAAENNIFSPRKARSQRMRVGLHCECRAARMKTFNDATWNGHVGVILDHVSTASLSRAVTWRNRALLQSHVAGHVGTKQR